MRNTPMHCTPEEINNMVERGLLPQGTTPLFASSTEPKLLEHPTASWLYRRFQYGSAALTKDEAYRIGNQLDALAARVHELEAGLANVRRDVQSSIESLASLPSRLVGLGHPEQPPERVVDLPEHEDERE